MNMNMLECSIFDHHFDFHQMYNLLMVNQLPEYDKIQVLNHIHYQQHFHLIQKKLIQYQQDTHQHIHQQRGHLLQRHQHPVLRMLRMDAADLKFENECFDVVLSYDGFEHFDEPELVLQEAIRVVKQGGYIYLFFGPLFMSPMGLHIYNTISVPYCQFLFSKEMLKDFVKAKGLNPFAFERDQIVSVRETLKHYLNRLKKSKPYVETYKL